MLTSWGDVERAAVEGLVDERTHCELKKGPPPSTQNSEVACDLASLSVEGGVLIYGIMDAGGGRAGDVVGVLDADSLKVRLVGVAQGLIQPALVCDVRVVEHPDDTSRGCVIVEVPPSPTAPHRAREKYWGRSAEGKRVLSDAEVQHLFATRRSAPDGFDDHLAGLADDFNPVPLDQRLYGQHYFVARPLQPALHAQPWSSTDSVISIVFGANLPNNGWGGASLQSLTFGESHPDGIMAVSRHLAEIREQDTDSLIRLLLHDDGGFDLASGLGTRMHRASVTNSLTHIVMLAAIISQVDSYIRLAAHIASMKGIGGTWRLGLRLNGLRHAVAADTLRDHFSRAQTFPSNEYVRRANVTSRDLQERPAEVTAALVTGLARGLGYADKYFPYDHPREIFQK